MPNEEILLLTIKLQQDSKNAKTINELTKANKQLAKLIKDAPKEGTEEYKKFEKTLESAKKQYAENAAVIKKFNKELRTGEKEVEATNDSLKGLKNSLKVLEKQYELLTKAQRKAADGRALQKQIKQTRAELLKAEKGIGDFRRQVGNYTRTLVGLNGTMGTLAASVGTLKTALVSLSAGFRGASKAAKAFLLSLGPITIAIAAITFALSKFQSVIDQVKALTAGLGAGFDVVVERFGRFGLAFEKLLSLDFKGFAEDAKAAFSGIGDEIANDIAIASELESRFQQIRRDRARNLVEDARLEVQIADARRKSQELENTNRLAALSQINRAIDLTNQKFEQRIDLNTRYVEALREQVNLSAETTSIEDQEKLAQAERELILLVQQRDDAVRGLVRRQNTLSKSNKKELNELQQLQQEQAQLTQAIKLQLLAGEDATKNLTRFAQVTAKLLEVETKFKELTDSLKKSVDAQAGSIAAYNAELAALNERLNNVNIESEQYDQIQNQILQTEAQRAVALGEVAKQIEILTQAQNENIASLEDSETELRLRQQAFDRIKAINAATKEGAKERLKIEKQLESDIIKVRENRINDQLDAIDKERQEIDSELAEQLELYADNETKKEEVLLQAQQKRDELRKKELDLEAALLKISTDNFKKSEEDKTKSTLAEEAKRKSARDLAIETSLEATSKIIELFSVLQQQQTEKQLQEIDTREEAQLKEAELTGKTEEQKQEIREKFQAEREELEKRAARERKALALAEAAIDIASAIIKALPNAPLAAAAGALGAIQLGIIAATNFANGGLVRPVELGDGRVVNAPNIPALNNGDNLLATVKVGEVVLNEQQQAALGGPSTFAAVGVPGFARGGKADLESIRKASPFANGGSVPRFHSSIKAKAFANGGQAAIQAASNIQRILSKDQEEFYRKVEQAVAAGSAFGSQKGIENAEITSQIERQKERTAKREANSNV